MKPRGLFILGSFVVGVTVRVPRWLVPGETLMGDHFDFSAGGKGTNQAIAAVRQGSEVRLMAAIGHDVFGETALALFEREGITKEHILEFAEEKTGCGIVTVVDGENQIALYAGANLAITPAHVAMAEASIADSALVLAQLEVPVESVLEVLRLGRLHSCRNVLNPAPAAPLPAEIYPLLDLLTPNSTEARILLGLPPDDPSTPEELAGRLLERGVPCVVMTLGAEGALIADSSGIRRIASAKVAAVDPTGAGDTFNGVLAAGLAEGKRLDDAVYRASRAGAMATLHFGTIDGIPTHGKLEQFILQNP